MNFTKEQRDRFYKAQNDFSRSTQNIVDKLVEDCDSLERLLEASRESRMLSAVPSEDEIEVWYIENYGVARDLNGKPSWNSESIGYRTDGDLFEMLNDFAKWIKQRGIAG